MGCEVVTPLPGRAQRLEAMAAWSPKSVGLIVLNFHLCFHKSVGYCTWFGLRSDGNSSVNWFKYKFLLKTMKYCVGSWIRPLDHQKSSQISSAHSSPWNLHARNLPARETHPSSYCLALGSHYKFHWDLHPRTWFGHSSTESDMLCLRGRKSKATLVPERKTWGQARSIDFRPSMKLAESAYLFAFCGQYTLAFWIDKKFVILWIAYKSQIHLATMEEVLKKLQELLCRWHPKIII